MTRMILGASLLLTATACIEITNNGKSGADTGGFIPGTATGTAGGTGTGTGTGGGPECMATVPASAVVVTSGSQQASDNLDVVVCPGAGLDGQGSAMNVFALAGAQINVVGDNNELWVEGGVSGTVSGNNNTSAQEPSATIVLVGTNNETIGCTTVALDLSALPQGC